MTASPRKTDAGLKADEGGLKPAGVFSLGGILNQTFE
jgi:hypothetical protein